MRTPVHKQNRTSSRSPYRKHCLKCHFNCI